MDDRDTARRGDVVGDRRDRAQGWWWTWDYGDDAGRRTLPWLGIFLVVFGALLLGERLVPGLENAGSLAVLAVGIAFLVSWAINRGTASLYAGAIITALALPDLLQSAGVNIGPGLGSICLGLAFVFVAAVRYANRGGIGWQAWLGVILLLVGGSRAALPNLDTVIWPIILVALGVLLLARGTGRTSGGSWRF